MTYYGFVEIAGSVKPLGNGYGIYIDTPQFDSPSGIGIQNYTGLFIDNSNSTQINQTSYAIHTKGGLVLFEDSVNTTKTMTANTYIGNSMTLVNNMTANSYSGSGLPLTGVIHPGDDINSSQLKNFPYAGYLNVTNYFLVNYNGTDFYYRSINYTSFPYLTVNGTVTFNNPATDCSVAGQNIFTTRVYGTTQTCTSINDSAMQFNSSINPSCGSMNAGQIWYNNSNNKHYGCNSTTWNAMY
jgi:hypothetical protein